MLVNDEDFDDTKDYFFNWVKEHGKTAFKTPCKNPLITNFISSGLSDAFKKDIKLEKERMFAIQDLYFVHGQGSFDKNGTAVFFYFTNINWGLVIAMTPKQNFITRFRMVGYDIGNGWQKY